MDGSSKPDSPKTPASSPAEASVPVTGTPRPAQPTISLNLEKMKEAVKDIDYKKGESRRFGDYELLEGIAQGGMGAIYKARQLKLNRTVALKTILAGRLAGEDQLKRFRAEAEAIANLDHPNIVPIYEVGDYDGQLFFSMRYVEGGSLDDKILHYKSDHRAAAELIAKVARAIHFAHQHGILHRDLKPDNILLDPNGEPQITDFGLAKRVDAGENITVTGEIIGTPNYMSPEQAEGKGVSLTTAVDVYGLGAVLYQLLTGRPPFRADSPLETLRLVIEREPQRPTTFNRRVDRDLETICLKCMEKDPQRRYGSAEAVAEDLERWLRKEPIQARPSGLMYRVRKWAVRRPAVAALLVTSLAGICTLLGVILFNEQRLQKERDFALSQERSANEQRSKAEALAEQSRQRLVRLNVGDGLRLQDEGDASGALLSFIDALRLDEGHKQSEEIHRTRIVSALRQSPRLIQFHTENSAIVAAVSSFDRRFLVTFTKKHARLWDVTTGQSIGKQQNLPEIVRNAAISPDGQQLVLINDGESALLWNWQADTNKTIRLEHSLPVNFATFSQDGALVATSGGQRPRRGLTRIWNARTGEAVSPEIMLDDEVEFVTFSPDGKILATASRDGWVKLWDVNTGKPAGKSVRHRSSVRHIAFSPDGKKMVTSSEDRTARVWDVATGEQLTPPLQHNGAVIYAEFSPDGQRIATANSDNTGRVWDAKTGDPLTAPLAHNSRVTRVRFSPDGRRVLTIAEKSARVWNAFTGQPLTPPLPYSAEILQALFSTDGRTVMIASRDHTVRVWDTPPAQQSSHELPLRGELRQTVFSRNGDHVLAVAERTVRLWNIVTGEPLSPVFGPNSEILAAKFTPDEKHVVTVSRDQFFRVWNPKDGKEVRQMKMQGPINFATFSPDGNLMLLANYDHQAVIANTRSGKPIRSSISHKGRIAYGQFSPDGRKVVTASWDNTARVWDTRTGLPVTPPLEHADRVVLASFSPDGKKVVTASWDNTARIWDSTTGKPLSPPLEHTAELTLASFSPDGRFVVTASTDNTARIWNAETGEPVTPLLQHNGWVVAAAFSPDGSRVVTASWDNTARIWDTQTGAPVTPPLVHRDRVDHASFTQDGRILFTASADGTTRLWDFTPDTRPTEDLAQLSMLLSGRRIDSTGSLVAVSAASLSDAWKKLKDKYPKEFSVTPEEIDAWHKEEADACEQSLSWYAAAFHLNWLAERHPEDKKVHARYEMALDKLKEANNASGS